MPKITNNNELRIDLLEAYEMLKADPRRINQVAELANTAGKVIAASKLQIEYELYRKKVKDFPKLDFMENQ
jgi:predicted nucleotidyltransferase